LVKHQRTDDNEQPEDDLSCRRTQNIHASDFESYLIRNLLSLPVKTPRGPTSKKRQPYLYPVLGQNYDAETTIRVVPRAPPDKPSSFNLPTRDSKDQTATQFAAKSTKTILDLRQRFFNDFTL
jgi:hypothetical protein